MNSTPAQPPPTTPSNESSKNYIARFRRIGLLVLLPILMVNFFAATRIMRELPEAFPGETLLPYLYGLVCLVGFILVLRDRRHIQPVAIAVLTVLWLQFTQRTWSLVYGPTSDDPTLPIFFPLYAYMPYAYLFFHIFTDMRRAQAISVAFWLTIAGIVFSRLVPEWAQLGTRYGATSLTLYLLVGNPMFIIALRLIGILSGRLAMADERVNLLELESRLHAEIAASEQRFNNAVRGSRDGVWEWPDAGNKAMWWSPRVLEMLGNPEPAPAACTTSLKELVHPEDYPRLLEAVADCVQSGATLDTECRLANRGDWRWFAVRGIVLERPEGAPAAMAGSIQDIHARKMAEQELRESHAALYHFAHMAAHDLQAPATRVQRLVDMLERNNPQLGENEKNRAILEGLHRQSIYMQGLVDALLEYAEADKVPGKVAVDLNRVLADVCDRLQDRIVERDAKLGIAQDLPSVLGDPVRYQQVFQNLLSNALKFAADTPRIQVTGRPQGTFAEVRVTDNGVGISAEHIDRIFEPLERAHPGDSFQGHGLGLAIVRRIVEGLGGSISVESQPGSGTTFTLALPLAP